MIAGIAVIFAFAYQNSDVSNSPKLPKEPKIEPVATSLHVRPVYTYALRTIAFNPAGTVLATGDGDGQIRLWHMEDGQLIRTIQAHEGWVFTVSFRPDGLSLASGGGDNLVRIWDATTGEKLSELAGHTDDVHGVAFLGDATHLVSGGDDRTVRIWDLANQQAKVLEGHTRQVTAIRVSPDGKFIASASRDANVLLWNAESGEQVRTMQGHEDDVLDLAFVQDGDCLATASYDGTARLWDVQTGEQLMTFADHEGRVLSVAVSPDGAQLATGCADKKLRIYDLTSGDLIHTIEFDTDPSSLDFTPDSQRLAIGLTDGTVRLFAMKENPPSPIAQLGKAGSSLPEESATLTPKEYLDLHQLVILPGEDNWKWAVTKLAEVGDGFTLQVTRDLDKTQLSPEDQTLLTNMQKAIHARSSKQDARQVAAAIQVRLERAATADLGCNPFEGQILTWTEQWLEPHLHEQEVVQELVRIRGHNKSDQVQMAEALRSRVQEYAAKLLQDEPVEATY